MNAHLLTDMRVAEIAELRGLRTVTAKKGNGVAPPDNLHQPAMAPCPWCGAPVVRKEQGGHVREFCNRQHKNSYNAALNKLSIIYARMLRTPGALQTWAAARVDPSLSAISALEAPKQRK